MTNFDRRPRGRNNNRRNGRRHNGPRASQVIKLNDQGRSFNHQRPRFNGNASKLFEKYNALAIYRRRMMRNLAFDRHGCVAVVDEVY